MNCLVFPVLKNIEQGLWEELVTVDVLPFASISMFRKNDRVAISIKTVNVNVNVNKFRLEGDWSTEK